MAPGSLLNMPSPEQGASTSTRSKKPPRAGHSRSGYAQETTAFITPSRSRFDSRAPARPLTGSLAQRSPLPSMAPAIWVALPPGAAHRSSMRSPGLGSRAVTADDAEGSCA